MSYNPVNWVNGETPINDVNLNNMDQGILAAHEILADHDEKIDDFANEQIPEEYVQAAVDDYISENQAGLATKTDVNNLDNKLSSEIVEIEESLMIVEERTSNNFIDCPTYKNEPFNKYFFDSYNKSVTFDLPVCSVLENGENYVAGVLFTDGTKTNLNTVTCELLNANDEWLKTILASSYSSLSENAETVVKVKFNFGTPAIEEYASKIIDTFYLTEYTNKDDIDYFSCVKYSKKLEDIEKSMELWYEGKFQSFLGDSNTANGKYIPFVVEHLKLGGYKNCGDGGSNIAGGGADAFHTDSRINTLDLSSDIVSIMGGTNDSANNRKIGELTLENYDTTTLVGGLNVTISKIYYKFLKVNGFYADIDYSGITQVSVAKDINLWIYTPSFATNETYINGGKLKEVVDTIIKVANMWGIPVADIYHNSLINMVNGSLYMSDGVHFDSNGGKKVASVIVNSMKSNAPLI